MTALSQRRLLRVAIYVSLVVSAAATFFLGDRLWAAARLGNVPIWMPLIAPLTFTIFVAVYSADRTLVARQRGWSLRRDLLPVAFALAVLSLLWPHHATEYRATVASRIGRDYAPVLLRSRQAQVRAAGCELLGLRAQLANVHDVQSLAETDPSPLVREVCAEAFERLSAGAAGPGAPSP